MLRVDVGEWLGRNEKVRGKVSQWREISSGDEITFRLKKKYCLLLQEGKKLRSARKYESCWDFLSFHPK